MAAYTPVDKEAKFQNRKMEIAKQAIPLLAKHGIANANMRIIARGCGVSLGTINYYFGHKDNLFRYCFRMYVETYIRNMDRVISQDGPDEEIVRTFSREFSNIIVTYAHNHRLWFDIKTRSLFDADFRSIIVEAERQFIKQTALFLKKIGSDYDPTLAYLVFQGIFQHGVQLELAQAPAVKGEVNELVEAFLNESHSNFRSENQKKPGR